MYKRKKYIYFLRICKNEQKKTETGKSLRVFARIN